MQFFIRTLLIFHFFFFAVDDLSAYQEVSVPDTIFFYVSLEGSDRWTGKNADVSTDKYDGPFRTLYRATEAVKEVREQGGQNTIIVQLREGTYTLDSSWVIPPQASGYLNSPTIFESYPNEEASIIGGVIIPRNKISKATTGVPSKHQDNFLTIHTTEVGLKELGSIEARGFPRPKYPTPVELFIDHQPQQLARWPNKGWAKIKEGAKGQFSYSGNRPGQWNISNPIWLHGFWARDWADSYEQVDRIDTAASTIFTKRPHGTYGYEKGKRFYALNLLEELDQPGEWHLDIKGKRIIFWPAVNIDQAEVMLSTLHEPLLKAERVSHVILKNLIFEVGRGDGIYLNQSNHTTLSQLTIRNVGNLGLTIHGGLHNTVSHCEVYNTGEGGIFVSGGKRDSLTSAQHLIVNNEIHHTNRWVKTYSPGVQINGVGITVKNNYLHDIPHMAIRILGNDNLIEKNEIANIGFETGDAGAIYIGKDWSMRGNVIAYNYFHHINSRYPRGMAGIYLDDLASGSSIHHNIFQDVQRAIIVGGGRDNSIEDNLFVACRISAVRIEYREATAAKADDQLRQRLANVPHRSEIWNSRYPELNHLLEDDPLAPKNNIVQNNVVMQGRWMEIAPKAEDLQIIKNNKIIEDADLKNHNELNMLLRTYKGLPEIPFHTIGIKN